jgi:hypothetical protein
MAVAEPDLEMALELGLDEELIGQANEIIREINRPAFNYWYNIPIIPGSTYLPEDHVYKALLSWWVARPMMLEDITPGKWQRRVGLSVARKLIPQESC